MTDVAPATAREAYAELPMRSPAPEGGVMAVLRRPYLLRLLTTRQLARQYGGSFLGFFWSYLQPAVRFVVYYFAIGVVLQLHKNVPYFAIHLFCGLMCVHYFVQSFGTGTRSIQQNRTLVQKMAIPREVFPMSAVIVSAFNAFPMLVLLVLADLLIGFHVSLVGLACGVVGLAMISVFAVGTALLFSAFNVYFRDFQNIVATVTQFMHFMVPMIYPYERIATSSIGGTWVEQLYLANPVATGVLLVQRLFWTGVAEGQPGYDGANAYPDHLLLRGVVMLAIGLVYLVFTQVVFRRLESKFPERL